MSTRSVLSPVSAFLGTTYGSTRTKRRFQLAARFAARIGFGACAGPKACDVAFIHVHADVKGQDVAQHHERLGVLLADPLAGPNVDLEHHSVHRRHDHGSADLGP